MLKDTINIKNTIETNRQAVLEKIAILFDYPTSSYLETAEDLVNKSRDKYPELSKLLVEFIDALKPLSPEEQEEVFTRTFDIAPICVPYLSSYTFGEESYERGDLMAKLKEIYAIAGFQSGNELPDHIRVTLSFLSTLDDQAGADLVHYVLAKPITEMFDKLKNANNPYSLLMNAVINLLEVDFSQEDRNA
ncbi:MAG: nitrate reductase molybdenum cofactor assembly chaperone [Candidatus Obscuribacterales bacterium]|nr:nitrate reductase molybdenum cofactor assembly chaperone [Candidatus Obscuribacterales bacterium]